MNMAAPLFAVLLCGVSAAAIAQPSAQVPIVVRWTDEAPDQVMLESDDGAPPLVKDAQKKQFSGTISRDPAKMLRIPISVRYGSNTFPLVLQIRPDHLRVDFSVGRRKPPSCGEPYVIGIERQSTTRADAIVQAFTAAFILQIPGDDACDDKRGPRAVSAQFRRYQELAQHSNQLFAMPDQVKQQFRTGSNMDDPNVRLAQYELNEKAALAHALQADVISADKLGNAASAFAASNVLLDTIRSDPDARPAFLREGLSERMLAKQTADMAERLEQAEAAMAGPE